MDEVEEEAADSSGSSEWSEAASVDGYSRLERPRQRRDMVTICEGNRAALGRSPWGWRGEKKGGPGRLL